MIDRQGRKIIQVYYGLELLEEVADEVTDPTFRSMVARLYNARPKLKSLVEVFALDPKTIRSWGEALKSRDPQRMSDQKFPILVPGLTATAIYGGGTYHSLARRSEGALMAWDTNIYGPLGTGGLVNSYLPTPVQTGWLGGQLAAAVAVGDEHNLTQRSDGKLYAWGLGNEGRFGDDNIGIHAQPSQRSVNASLLDPGDRWQGIYSGADSQHSLAILAVSLQPTAITLPAVVISKFTLNTAGMGRVFTRLTVTVR